MKRKLAVPIALGLLVTVVMAAEAEAQTSTKVLNFTGGTGFSGTLDGTINGSVKSQTNDGTQQTFANLNVTDLDIDFINSGGFLNFFPNGDSRNNTASTAINIGSSSISVDLNSTSFSSPVGGTISVTAGDNLVNGVVGQLDAGIPGSDGAWDDPGSTGVLNGAVVNGITATLSNPISATANVSGGLGAAIPNDITIPNVVDTALLDLDVRLKNSSSVSVAFDPVQSVSLSGVSISTSTPTALSNPGSNFVEGTHPTGAPVLDLSAGGVGFATTTIAGTINADLTGTISANLDIAADLTVLGFIPFTIDFNDVVDGPLSDPGVTLLSLSEAVSLPGVELPFLIEVLHEPTANVDFDDILAELRSGTLGLTLPFSITEEVVLTIPTVNFSLGSNSGVNGIAGSFSVSEVGQSGTIELEHLQAELGGQVVLDLAADLELSADLFATAFEANGINVAAIPEPTSGLFLAVAALGAGAVARRRRG